MSKNLVYLLALVLLVFNVLLVVKGFKEARSSVYTSLLSPLKESIVDKSPENFLNTELYNQISNGDKRFYVISIIQERGCSSCIRNEISAINNLPKNVWEQLIVVHIGSNREILRNSGLSVNYLSFESIDNLFDEPVDYNSLNPISLILDKNFIYDVRKVDVTKHKSELITESFYDYIEDLFTH